MVVDVHFHLLPPALVADAASGRLGGVGCVTTSRGAPALVFPDRPPVPVPPGITDWERAAAHLTAAGVDRAVVTPWASAIGDSLDAPDAVAYARRMNHLMAEAVAGAGGLARALAILPTTAPDEVGATLREAVDLGLRGAYLATQMGEDALDAPRFEAVWRAAEELDVPVFLHPANVPEVQLERFNLSNLLGNPMATSTAAATLIFGGVLDRHPHLRVALSHGGGTLPYGIGRLDQGFAARRGGPLGSAEPPSAYLRRFWYDAVVYRAQALRYLVETVGADRVMLGTDYPFDMEMPQPVSLVRAALADEGERAAVLAETARALYQWP